MYSTKVQNRKYALFVAPVPPTLDWQTLKDRVRAYAPNVTHVEVPKDVPVLRDHALILVKGPVDARNLYGLLLTDHFFGREARVHIYDTNHPTQARLVMANCKANCQQCFSVPVTDLTAQFLPGIAMNGLMPGAAMDLQHGNPTPFAYMQAASESSSPCSAYSPAVNSPLRFQSSPAPMAAHVTPSRSVFIKNLSSKTTATDLRSVLEREVGSPTTITFSQNHNKPNATVELRTSMEAQRAVERLDGYTLRGWQMRVHHDRNQDSSRSRSSRPMQSANQVAHHQSKSTNPPIANGSNWSVKPPYRSRR